MTRIRARQLEARVQHAVPVRGVTTDEGFQDAVVTAFEAPLPAGAPHPRGRE